MIARPDFELVKVAEDYLLVPVGQEMERFNGTVVLNEVSAYIFEKLKDERRMDELLQLLIEEFDVDPLTAKKDLTCAIDEMKKIGVIDD